MSIVLAFGHKARQGKDLAAKAIIEQRGHLYDIKTYAFAAVPKFELNQVDQFALCMKLGVPYDFSRPMSDPLCQTEHGKQSALLQRVANDARKKDPNRWVKIVADQIAKDKPQVAIVTDIRYRNEFNWVRSMGGTTVKFTRLGFVDLSRDPNHISEVDLDGVTFDYEVTSREGDTDQLKEDAVTVFDLVLHSMQPDVAALSELCAVRS